MLDDRAHEPLLLGDRQRLPDPVEICERREQVFFGDGFLPGSGEFVTYAGKPRFGGVDLLLQLDQSSDAGAVSGRTDRLSQAAAELGKSAMFALSSLSSCGAAARLHRVVQGLARHGALGRGRSRIAVRSRRAGPQGAAVGAVGGARSARTCKLTVTVRTEVAAHRLRVQQPEEWIASQGRTPREQAEKVRIRELLGD